MGRPLDVSAQAYERDSAALLRLHHRIATDARFPQRSETLLLLDDLLPRVTRRVVTIQRRKKKKSQS